MGPPSWAASPTTTAMTAKAIALLMRIVVMRLERRDRPVAGPADGDEHDLRARGQERQAEAERIDRDRPGGHQPTGHDEDHATDRESEGDERRPVRRLAPHHGVDEGDHDRVRVEGQQGQARRSPVRRPRTSRGSGPRPRSRRPSGSRARPAAASGTTPSARRPGLPGSRGRAPGRCRRSWTAT